jgi:hypothetical protein
MEEETGPPVTGEPAPTRPPIIITPPPLSQAQVDKIVDAIEAVGEAAEALGSLYGHYCKWVLQNFKPMLIPPVGPTIQPTTPP